MGPRINQPPAANASSAPRAPPPREGVINMKPPTTATMPGTSCISHCFVENCQLESLKNPKLNAGPINAAAITQPPSTAIRKPKGITFGVHGSTEDDAKPHFLGWRDEVDPDELFESGRAWGLKVVRRSAA